MKKSAVALSLLALAACPASPLDSVDGLGGGALSSELTAPAVSTTTLTTDSLHASAEVTAGTVTVGSVTSAGPVSGSSLVVQRGAARVSFFGLIVGATPRINGETGGDADNTTPNYAVRQRACAEAYPATADGLPAAHVCTAQEAMAHALQAPETVPVSVSGGIVHTYGHFWFAAPTAEGAEQLVSDAGAMVGRVGTTSSSLRLHRRAEDGAWTLRIEDGAAVDEPLVCCQ
jgi:hypothetical protein